MPNRTKLPCDGLISLVTDEKLRNRINLELHRVPDLRQYDAFECHVVFYPYSERIGSRDYTVLPFEEYVKDIARYQRSAYARIRSNAKEIFGALLGLLVFLLVLKYTHTDVITMESLIGIFAAYFIGKDLWDDIEAILQEKTRGSRLKYRESDYRYQADKNSTLLTFNQFARRNQHHREVIYPAQMDFIMRSQSSTARMRFDQKGVSSVAGESAHLLAIEVDERKLGELQKAGYLVGVKVTFSRRLGWFCKCVDAYQSFDNGKVGCVDDDGSWKADAAFTRTHYTLGRLRWTSRTGYLTKTKIIG